ncbi:MAG: J domain-containing protein [Alphaproteobacteria bacterium]|nr:J domain-containing protein [Alphaproteobacteria bacterium]
MPGCALPGLHKAPKNRALDEYYKFCVDHVRDYNKAWNFFDGMADHEVEEHMVNALYGERPTWRYDNAAATEDILKRKAWQTYHFTDKAPPQDDKNGSGEYGRNTPEFKAMAVMGLEPPLSLDCIRQRYKELAKKHHPDLNRGCTKSEELLKEINMAYTILKLAFENFEKLPERP